MAEKLQNPMERLTQKKNLMKPNIEKDIRKELTFTPKINDKSRYIDNKRTPSLSKKNRFERLHHEAENIQEKLQRKKEEKENQMNQEDTECFFQPELISNYKTDFVAYNPSLKYYIKIRKIN